MSDLTENRSGEGSRPVHKRASYGAGGRFHVTMTLACSAIVAYSIYGVHQANIDVQAASLASRAGLLLLLLGGAAFYRWRRVQPFVDLILMTFWAVLVTNLHAFPMFIVARRQVPMSDALLASLDRMLGVEVPAVLSFVRQTPLFNQFFVIAYNTLILLILLAIIVPPLLGEMAKAKEFALSCLIAACLGMFIFSMFQAVGPWSHYGFEPTPEQANYTKVFAALKTDRAVTLDLEFREGLICFPSFHAALAVLAGSALWFQRYLRWPATVVASLVTISTVTTGWHYIVDTLAGIGLAFVSIAAAKAYLGKEITAAPDESLHVDATKN